MLPIGDTLLTTPTIRALWARYPDARITALVHRGAAPVLRYMPAVNGVVVLPTGGDWAGSGSLLRTLRHLRAGRFDVAVDFTSPAYKWISFAAGIPRRTYMKFDPLWWIVPGTHPRWRATHAARHYYDCARELDLPPWDEVDHVPSLDLPAADRAAACLFLERHNLVDGDGPLVGIHVGGAGLGGRKRWPPRRFADLADRLRERWGARILLLGGPDDAGLAGVVAAVMRVRPASAVGAVPLLTSFALIASCDLFVGNDSGPLHAAAAVGTPYVGIFGPTCPANFAPLPAQARQGRIVQPEPPCRRPHYFVGGAPVWRRPCCDGTCRALAALTADTVFKEVDALLRECLTSP